MSEIDRVAALLEPVGPAHHAAFIETGGEDPDWAAWYSAYVLDDLRSELGASDLTQHTLTEAFERADRAYRTEQPDTTWWHFYAEQFAREFGQ